MNITPNYNPVENRMEFTFTCNLLRKYFSNFYGLVTKYPGVPEGTNVTPGQNSSQAVISFPVDQSMVKEDPNRDGVGVSMRRDEIEKLNAAINVFINGALKKELKTTEFIPLKGYDISLLQVDIKAAIENKRSYCIIKDFDEYLESGKTRTYNFNQVMVEYGTPEWADISILIEEGNLAALKKKYTPKLQFVEWV